MTKRMGEWAKGRREKKRGGEKATERLLQMRRMSDPETRIE